MSHVQSLDRVFRFGATTLPIAPGLSIEQALNLYRGTYPHLAHCSVDEPQVEGGQLVYAVVRPPVQTKGAAQILVA